MSKFSGPLSPVSHLFVALMLVGVTERHAAAQPPPMVGSAVVELRYFQSVPERVLQEEHDHWTMNVGIKVEF